MRKTSFEESVFLDTNSEQVDAVLYQAMFDETIRLRRCRSQTERDRIRRFLTEAYQLYVGKSLQSANRDTVPESMMPQPKQTSTQG